MTKEFLGKGWKFPIGVDANGLIKMSSHEEDIGESIRLILSTSKSERVMRPDFGCGVHDFVFGVVGTSFLGLVESSVRDALVRWEPRIELMGVRALADRIDQGILLVSIDYVVRTTNTQFNLVYPFYLTEGK